MYNYVGAYADEQMYNRFINSRYKMMSKYIKAFVKHTNTTPVTAFTVERQQRKLERDIPIAVTNTVQNFMILNTRQYKTIQYKRLIGHIAHMSKQL